MEISLRTFHRTTSSQHVATYWTILPSTFRLTVLSSFRSIYFRFIAPIEGYPEMTCTYLCYLDHCWSVVCCMLTVPLLAAVWLYIPTAGNQHPQGGVWSWLDRCRRVTEVMRVPIGDLSPARCDLGNHTLVSFGGWLADLWHGGVADISYGNLSERLCYFSSSRSWVTILIFSSTGGYGLPMAVSKSFSKILTIHLLISMNRWYKHIGVKIIVLSCVGRKLFTITLQRSDLMPVSP